MGVPQIEADCRSGALGCVACKRNCAEKLNGVLKQHREKRATISDNDVLDILQAGEVRAREVAQQTMGEVREAMKVG